MVFDDRNEAGRLLGVRLAATLAGHGPLVVLGLPRGGVPVAARVAEALDAELDVVVVRKLALPRQPELALGAIGEGGVRLVDADALHQRGLPRSVLAEVEQREQAGIDHRVRQLRGGRPLPALEGATAVVVDDGVATGATARAACLVVRARGAGRVVLATPVAPVGLAHRVPEADEVVALRSPEPFGAVSRHYLDFSETSEAQVLAELTQHRRPLPT